MKKPDLHLLSFLKISLVCLCFLPTLVSVSQEKRELRELQNLQKLGTDQLNLSLNQSIEACKTGKTLAFAGIGAGIIGGVFGWQAIAHAGNWSKVHGIEGKATGIYLMEAGLITTAIGIPIWIGGQKKRKNIEIALAKAGYRSYTESTSLNFRFRIP